MVVRFIDLDTASHNYGLEGPGRIRTLQETDRFVERIISAWRHKNPNLAVLCFADHGMVPVKSSINVEASLSRTGLRAFRTRYVPRLNNGPVLGRRRALGRSEDPGEIGLWKNSLRERSGILQAPSILGLGRHIFLLKPGFVISPNFFDRNGHVKAMHWL